MALDFWNVIRQVLIFLVTISLYFPLNVPLAALAYRLRLGRKAMPLSRVGLWVRSTLAALGMGVLCISLMGFDRFLVDAELKPGPVHLVMFLAFVPLGTWWMSRIFALNDMVEGLSTLLLYVFIPGLVLVIVKLTTGYDAPTPLVTVKEWIAVVPS
jgi:hypothetical protein